MPTSDSRGVRGTPFKNHQTETVSLIAPSNRAAGTTSGPAFQVPRQGDYLFTQITGPIVGGMWVNGKIEKSDNGVDGWTTLFEFKPLNTVLKIESKLAEVMAPFIRYTQTLGVGPPADEPVVTEVPPPLEHVEKEHKKSKKKKEEEDIPAPPPPAYAFTHAAVYF